VARIGHLACRRNPAFPSGSLETLQGLRSKRREDNNVKIFKTEYSGKEMATHAMLIDASSGQKLVRKETKK
jgi:hypothetical protein